MSDFLSSLLAKAAVIVIEVLTMRLVEALVAFVARRFAARAA
ncbi:hypothetical protein PS9374_02990 [Planomonospora sphaerica]|uniref:Uncharacterized protein n=1 Tax=Planomonospora sphaerica TaxID=161355 RepID=A0A171CWN1_9ACTN|nr:MULTISPECIES: hypothetical protein [Planomonospora]GAT67337.1 hypothetical protein PS9374_02990 [Planomonospora sphaerica]